MNKKDHHHQGDHRHMKKAPHKDWRLWTVVILMLAGMAMYVFSDNLSLPWSNNPEAPMPEAE